MNRRNFVATTAVLVAGSAALIPMRAYMEPTDDQQALFADASGVAFRQYSAVTVEDNGRYFIDGESVNLYFDWYSVLFPTADAARAAFDSWAEWFSDSGDRYDDDRPEPFPIGIYEGTDYGLVRPESNASGGLDMQGTWNLEGEIGKPAIGHMAMMQTGALISIQWLHADKPEKCHITLIGNEVFDVMYAGISASPPDGSQAATEDSLLALLPEPEQFRFDDSVIATVDIERDWTITR